MAVKCQHGASGGGGGKSGDSGGGGMGTFHLHRSNMAGAASSESWARLSSAPSKTPPLAMARSLLTGHRPWWQASARMRRRRMGVRAPSTAWWHAHELVRDGRYRIMSMSHHGLV